MQTSGITAPCVYQFSVLFCGIYILCWGTYAIPPGYLPLRFHILRSFIGDPSWQGTLDPHTGQGPVIKSSRVCNDGAVSGSGCVYGTYMEGPRHVWLTCHYTSAQMPHGHRHTACTPCTCTQKETSGHYLQKQQPPRHLTSIDIYGCLLNKLWHYRTHFESRLTTSWTFASLSN